MARQVQWSLVYYFRLMAIPSGFMNIVWSCGNTAGASLGGFLADVIG